MKNRGGGTTLKRSTLSLPVSLTLVSRWNSGEVVALGRSCSLAGRGGPAGAEAALDCCVPSRPPDDMFQLSDDSEVLCLHTRQGQDSANGSIPKFQSGRLFLRAELSNGRRFYRHQTAKKMRGILGEPHCCSC